MKPKRRYPILPRVSPERLELEERKIREAWPAPELTTSSAPDRAAQEAFEDEELVPMMSSDARRWFLKQRAQR